MQHDAGRVDHGHQRPALVPHDPVPDRIEPPALRRGAVPLAGRRQRIANRPHDHGAGRGVPQPRREDLVEQRVDRRQPPPPIGHWPVPAVSGTISRVRDSFTAPFTLTARASIT